MAHGIVWAVGHPSPHNYKSDCCGPSRERTTGQKVRDFRQIQGGRSFAVNTHNSVSRMHLTKKGRVVFYVNNNRSNLFCTLNYQAKLASSRYLKYMLDLALREFEVRARR